MQSEIGAHACLELVRAQNLENLMSVFDTNPCDMDHVLSHFCVHLALAIPRLSQALFIQFFCVFILNSNSKVLNYKTDFRKALWLVRKSMFQDTFN